MADIGVDLVISLAKTVVAMGMNMKANKERCKRVAKRVQSLLPLLARLKEMNPRQISEVVDNALKELSATLVNAQNIMQKFRNCNTVKSFVFNNAHEEMFQKINERLDDSFQILTGAIHIENYEKLDDVWKAVSGKNEPAHPTQPFPSGFSNTCGPSPLPTYPTMPYSPQNVLPTTNSNPAITVTNAPNPPYPPAQQPPAYNPNALMVPAMNTNIACAMPPRVVTVPARPVMTVHEVYGTVAPRPQYMVPNTVVYGQAMAPQQVIMLAPRPQPQVMTVYMNRPW
ncbi:unnamed protein product [Knipowitschia caucasica]|uniref:Mixed lineage kinase domain-containing protein n=1 Tax=Knipowitschia caucasica TaxID=637954 RepID=A0AAV2KPV5_KNICA